jgi:splicing factor 1
MKRFLPTKVGLLIGPRGNTLKKMEADSGAKIAIRGKGSVKEGKGRSDAAHTSNQEEDLHCLIMADTEEKVNKAKKLIHNVIETVSRPSFLHLIFCWPKAIYSASPRRQFLLILSCTGCFYTRRPKRTQAQPTS